MPGAFPRCVLRHGGDFERTNHKGPLQEGRRAEKRLGAPSALRAGSSRRPLAVDARERHGVNVPSTEGNLGPFEGIAVAQDHRQAVADGVGIVGGPVRRAKGRGKPGREARTQVGQATRPI